MLPTSDVKDRDIWIRVGEKRKCQVPFNPSLIYLFFLAALIRERKRRKK